MKILNIWFLTLSLSVSYALGAEQKPALPRQYLLGIREVRAVGGDNAKSEFELRSVETPVILGREFYVRTVGGGVETLFRGHVEGTDSSDSFVVDYFYKRSSLRATTAPTVVEGKVTLKVKEPTSLVTDTKDELSPGDSEIRHELSIVHFQPVIGLRYPIPGWSVRLVDEAGQPISNARAVLCDHQWDVVTGSFKSDTNGIVKIDDFRELLPIYTFVAEHRERGLFAYANFDRNRADKIFKVTMRKTRERPKGFEASRVFE